MKKLHIFELNFSWDMSNLFSNKLFY